MVYTEVSFNILPYNQFNEEILIGQLEKNGFDSFWQDQEILKGYIPSNDFSSEIINQIKQELEPHFNIRWTIQELQPKNWNEEWEKNFPYILIADRCLIKAPFHNDTPETEYNIIIEPKMSFGTGHHSTTSLMIEHLLSMNLSDIAVLDVGCGTGILSILASKMKAKKIIAIDNDKWAYENTIENIQKNKCSNIEVVLGDINSIANTKFDLILANINRNVLLEDMEKYKMLLNRNGSVVISGFLIPDMDIIIKKAKEINLYHNQYKEKNSWVSLILNSSN